MRKYFPIIISFILIIIAGYVVIVKKHEKRSSDMQKEQVDHIGTFGVQKKCARFPQFIKRLKIPQPVMIDLSQKRYTGLSLYYGQKLEKTLHLKQWEQYEHFSTYTLDEQGNIYLVPMPFISIHPTTFNLQKNIYKLDTQTGKISIFMHFDDVKPTAGNPYGINAIVYDCQDKTLWVAAIDESDYQSQKGIIYHINPKNKEILQRIEGVDALSMALIKSSKGKFLLVGSARDSGLYAYAIKHNRVQEGAVKLLELSNSNEHIRKIKVTSTNELELQSIPFSYTLITQTAKKDRMYYQAIWDKTKKKWKIK
jgi:hypothetical protein